MPACLHSHNSSCNPLSFHQQVVEVRMNYDEINANATEAEIHSGAAALLYQPNTDADNADIYSLKAKIGHHKRLSGFQAETICISPWIDSKTPPYRITAMCHNVYASL